MSVTSLREGDQVEVAKLGRGVVHMLTGAEIIVRLEELGGLRVKVALEDILAYGGKGNGSSAAAADQTASEEWTPLRSRSAETPEQTKARRKRRAIEALRFGLVPSQGLRDLTLGYDELRDWTIGILPHSREENKRSTVAEVIGPFGTGKSHTMEVIREVARSEGYLTASVEVDGQTVSLSNPDQLLHSIWSKLRSPTPSSHTPLLDVYLEAISAGQMAPSIAPRGVDRIRDNYESIRLVRRAGLLNEFAEDLEAILTSDPAVRSGSVSKQLVNCGVDKYALRLRPMIGLRVDDRPYDFTEALIGHTAVGTLTRFKGLVLTIDEFEVEHRWAQRWDRVQALLQVLVDYFSGKLDHPDVPLTLVFATVGQTGHAGDAKVDEIVAASNGATYKLKAWNSTQRAMLAERMHTIYCGAYDVDREFDRRAAAILVQQRGKDIEIRAFIKHYVAWLDREYGPPRGD